MSPDTLTAEGARLLRNAYRKTGKPLTAEDAASFRSLRARTGGPSLVTLYLRSAEAARKRWMRWMFASSLFVGTVSAVGLLLGPDSAGPYVLFLAPTSLALWFWFLIAYVRADKRVRYVPRELDQLDEVIDQEVGDVS